MPALDLPSLDSDLYNRLREDIRLRGIQIPILVDSSSGEVIDGRQRKRIAAELGIRNIPTLYVGCLSDSERVDLRFAVNLYRRHLTRAQMRELIAWSLRERPDQSDRCVARTHSVTDKTVAAVRRRLEEGAEIPILDMRTGSDGKPYPAAKPVAFGCSPSEGHKARSLLERLGNDAPPRTASLRVLQKLANRKDRAELQLDPAAKLPARIRVECCDFRDLSVPDNSVDLMFTDPPWSREGRRRMPEFAVWAARKLRPEGGLLLIYPGKAGMLEIGSLLAKRLTYLWAMSCHNGRRGSSTLVTLKIHCCWRPMLLFCRGTYRPRKVFDDAIISTDRDKTYHDSQQPLSEALFYIDALTGAKATVCDPFLGSATTACACVRLGSGRKFWGSEIDPRAFAIARSRIAGDVKTGGTTAIPAMVAIAR
jgi:DNA methylase